MAIHIKDLEDKYVLYLIKSADGEKFKIGITSNLRRRIYSIRRCWGALKLEESNVVLGDYNGDWLEEDLQKAFYEFNIYFHFPFDDNGRSWDGYTEWYDISCFERVLQFIKNYGISQIRDITIEYGIVGINNYVRGEDFAYDLGSHELRWEFEWQAALETMEEHVSSTFNKLNSYAHIFRYLELRYVSIRPNERCEINANLEGVLGIKMIDDEEVRKYLLDDEYPGREYPIFLKDYFLIPYFTGQKKFQKAFSDHWVTYDVSTLNLIEWNDRYKHLARHIHSYNSNPEFLFPIRLFKSPPLEKSSISLVHSIYDHFEKFLIKDEKERTLFLQQFYFERSFDLTFRKKQ